MRFKILRKTDSGTYFPGPTNSDYLSDLSDVFTDGVGFARNIKNDLKNPSSRGRYGNITEISINKSIVQIHPNYGIDSITEPIKINREELLRILDEGLVLMERQVPYIVIRREK